MAVAAWIDQLACDIVTTTAAIRPLVRRLHYDPPPYGVPLATRGATGQLAITISGHEARTLLRAAQPVPQTQRPTRDHHARMIAALATCAGLMLEANDPMGGGPATIAAALQLRDAIDTWTAAARWLQATTGAGVSWGTRNQPPADLLDIIAVTRLSTPENREQVVNPALIEDHPAHQDGRAAAARRRARPAAKPAGQGTLLLPIPGASPAASASPHPAARPAQAPAAAPADEEAA